MNITKLNKPFVAQTVLTAAQLNNVTDKIDTIIDNWPQSITPIDPSNDSITDEINSAKNWINGKIGDLLAMIDQFEEGHTTWDAGDSFLNLFKGSNGKAALMYYGLVDANGHPYFNILVDEHGVKPAAIIGAITDNSGTLNSQIGISADNIILDGNVTLTNKLTAVEASISNIDVPNLATIKQAVIDDLTTNNLTITGTLTYNKLIGNVLTISTTSQLSDDTYFVLFTGEYTADINNYPVVSLPANNLVEGLTLFISVGSKCFKLQANRSISFFTKIETGVLGEYQISGPVNNPVGSQINAFNAGWNGIVEFIYTSSGWMQLIHNINV